MRHIVTFQADGPAPQPDIEGWLDAGRPTDSLLAGAWDTMNTARYGAHALPATPRSEHTDELTSDPEWAASVLQMDRVVRAFPYFDALVVTCARVSRFIEEAGFELPPLPE